MRHRYTFPTKRRVWGKLSFRNTGIMGFRKNIFIESKNDFVSYLCN